MNILNYFKDALDNSHPFCYTNPREYVKLTNRDKVFVLSFNMPNDLRYFTFNDKCKKISLSDWDQ